MSRREEGPLSDPAEQRGAQKLNAAIRRQNEEDLRTLERNPAFRRWFGRWALPTVLTDIGTTNGGDLQALAGRRRLVLEQLGELDATEPGFLERVLVARRMLTTELHALAQQDMENT
jgi:hypothetical protein